MSAPCRLPSMFLLRVGPETNNQFILLTASSSLLDTGEKVWEFAHVKYPEIYVRGVWRQDGLELPNYSYTVRKEDGLTRTKIWRTKNYVVTDGGNVYEYGMFRPNTTLPRTVYEVSKGLDIEKVWHFNAGNNYEFFTRPGVSALPRTAVAVAAAVAPAPVAAPRVIVKKEIVLTPMVPKHVFRGFVEAAIAKKEECPITMELLTIENAASGPCCHLFQKEALVRIAKSSGKCPTCRGDIIEKSIISVDV